MGLSILNNIPSLEAQNQLAMTNMNLQTTLFQLSSGSKINSGADDPAGLSIADGLQANISALTQSTQNVTDGVGMLQTADGALSQVTTLLNRAVTLATEAGNAGLTTDQQNALQTEYSSITQEINQIGSNTTYNNNQVFTGQLTSVFLSDGSQVDAADPTISLTIPQLSSAALGLSSYATGTLDVTANPNAGNTVQIGQQTYTFTTSGNANAAGDVALGNNVEGTLQNLQSAVNGTGTASPGTYGVGTVANSQAQIVSVNGGSAVVQALTAGGAGNNVQLITNLTSSAGTTGTDLSGATNATYNAGTLTLTGQPGFLSSATGSLTLAALPDTITNATGTFNLTAGQPTAAVNASGTLNLTAAQPTAADTINLGGTTYTFVATGTAASGHNDISIGASQNATLLNLQSALAGGVGAAGTFFTVGNAANNTVTESISGGGTGTVATFTATTAGVGGAGLGNSTVLTATGTIAGDISGSGTLAGGVNGDTLQVGGQTYSFVVSGQALEANYVALGGGTNATLNNLAAAVNGTGSASATTYGTGTAAVGTATLFVANAATEATITATTAGTGNGSTTGNSVALVATAVGSDGFANTVGPSGTLSGGAAADTVTLGATTYTFVAAGQALSADQVAIVNTVSNTNAQNVAATLTNLQNAVNGTGTVSNTTYGVGTTANATATVSGVSNGVATITAGTGGVAAPGSAGNTVALTVNSQTGSATVSGTGYLAGGANADTVTVGSTTYTFVAPGQATAGNEVALGGTVQETLDNLKAAVDSTAITNGSASTYHLANAAALQGASGATIASDTNGVATIQALSAAGLALNAVFGNGDATGSIGGLTTQTLSGGATGAAASGNIDLTGGQPTIGNATATLTFTGPAVAGDKVAVAGQTYTFTTQPNATLANDVIVGANLQASLQNLQDAVNGGGAAGVNVSTGVMTPAGTAVVSGFTLGVGGTTGTVNVSATALGVNGNGVTLSYTNSGAGTNVASGNTQGGGTSDTITIGAVTYTFVANNTATAGHNEVALGVATGSGPTAVSALENTLKNLQGAVNAANDATGNGAGTFELASNNASSIQGGSGATISAVNGGQAVVTAAATGTAGNALVLSDTFANAANVAGSPGGAAAATAATGNFDLTGNPLQGNTVTIGTATYTFVSSAPTAANQVMIGTDQNGTLNNLMQAVNNGPNGTGSGVTYGTGTVANTEATITGVNGGQATITASTLGTTGNSVALSAELSNGVGGGTVGTVDSQLSGGGASVDLTSATDAQNALTVIAGAISTVASSRGAIGSSINQMNAAVQVINNTSQNLTSSLSGIQDANIGKVVANLSKYQVLEQTGIAALTQANQQEQTVLKLLQ